MDGVKHPILQFDQLCYVDQFDDATVQYSFDDGLSWTRIPDEIAVLGNAFPIYMGQSVYDFGQGDYKFCKASRAVKWLLVPVDDTNRVWSGSTDAWITETFDLTPILNFDSTASDSIRFRFGLIDDPASSPGRTGTHKWFIDNVQLYKAADISGTVYFDADTNAIKDSGEVGVENIQLKLLPFNTIASTNNVGNYRFSNLGFGTYEVVILPPKGVYTTALSDTVKLVVDSFGSFRASFGITTKDTINTSFNTYIGPARCSQWVNYRLSIQNHGISTSGVYYFIKDSQISYFSTTISEADSVNGDTIFFSFDTLTPFEIKSQWIYCHLPSITVLPVGSIIYNSSLIYSMDSSGQKINGSEKSSSGSTAVRCAYDPNDKQVSPVGTGSLGYIDPDTPLKYTIRFQNTGNDTAFKVVLIDTLSSFLDYSSFEFIDASHNVVNQLKNNGELTFTFDNILLVDSTTNEPESNGYVVFGIKPKMNLADSTTVANKAAIYFDFNPPIITNTVFSTFRKPVVVSILEQEKDLDQLSIFPNPTEGILRLRLPEEAKQLHITVYNIQGQRVFYQEGVNPKNLRLDLRSFKEGVYFITAESDGNYYSSKVVLSRATN